MGSECERRCDSPAVSQSDLPSDRLRRNDFLGCFTEGLRGFDFQSALGQEGSALFDISAFEADDEGDGNLHGGGGSDDAPGDNVTVHDAAKNVDQDSPDILITEDDFECLGYLLFSGASTDVEEVGRVSAKVLDDVHGGHGQAGAVYHTGDIPIESDVVEGVSRCFHLSGISFVGIA